MKQLILRSTSSILALGLLAISFTVSVSADGKGSGFTLSDLKGSYAVSFDGFLIDNGQAIPVVAVAQIIADGAGGVSDIVRTLNLGGQVLRQVGEGIITNLNPDGTGTGEFTITTIDPPGIPDSVETIEFVITKKKADEIDFIVTGSDFGAIVARGNATKQKPGR